MARRAVRKPTSGAPNASLLHGIAQRNVIKQGKLEKLSSGINKRWQTRFFALRDGGVLPDVQRLVTRGGCRAVPRARIAQRQIEAVERIPVWGAEELCGWGYG